jgi:hypothetical protein
VFVIWFSMCRNISLKDESHLCAEKWWPRELWRVQIKKKKKRNCKIESSYIW